MGGGGGGNITSEPVNARTTFVILPIGDRITNGQIRLCRLVYAGTCNTVGIVSDCRYVSDCRSTGREFDSGPVQYFR